MAKRKSISHLFISLSAKTGQFTKAMYRATAPLRRFAKIALSVGRSALRIGSMFAIAGLAGIAYFVRQSFTMIDALAKTADKLGMTTEALAGLQYAASFAGLETKTLYKALTNMTVKIGQAAERTSEATYALNTLGLSARVLIKQSPSQMLLEIAEAMNKLKNHTERVRAAYELFGGRATGILNLLKLGRKAIEAYTTEAIAMGLAITRVDAAKIEEANDAFFRLTQLLRGTANIIAVQIAPYVEAISDAMATWGIKSVTSGDLIERVLRTIGRLIGWVADVIWKGMTLAVQAFRLLIYAVAEASTYLMQLFKDTKELWRGYGVNVEPWIASLQVAAIETTLFQRRIEDMIQAMQGIVPSRAIDEWSRRTQAAAQAVAQAAAKAAEQRRNQRQVLPEINKEVERLIANLKKEATTYGMTRRQIQLYNLEALRGTEQQKVAAKALIGQLGRLDAMKERQGRFERNVGKESTRYAAALQAGTASAYSAALGAGTIDRDIAGNTRRIAELQEEETRLQAETNALLQRLAAEQFVFN